MKSGETERDERESWGVLKKLKSGERRKGV